MEYLTQYEGSSKIIVAPQIVIYKNIFKNSENIINILNKDSDDSLLSKWDNWYDQGKRKFCLFDKDISIKNEEIQSFVGFLCGFGSIRIADWLLNKYFKKEDKNCNGDV
jgi:hypothetical protein